MYKRSKSELIPMSTSRHGNYSTYLNVCICCRLPSGVHVGSLEASKGQQAKCVRFSVAPSTHREASPVSDSTCQDTQLHCEEDRVSTSWLWRTYMYMYEAIVDCCSVHVRTLWDHVHLLRVAWKIKCFFFFLLYWLMKFMMVPVCRLGNLRC